MPDVNQVAAAPDKFRISVIIVSDYETGEKTWTDERRILHAFAAQDISEPFEIILAEPEKDKATFPEDLLAIAPNTRVVFFALEHSWALKDAALPYTTGNLIAVFEADSRPLPGWMRLMAKAAQDYPAASAFSGRTTYDRTSPLKRSLALIDRGYLEVGGTGFTTQVCNNAALYRRELLEAHSFPADENPFVNSRLRRSELLKAGYKFLFLPDAESIHEFGGLPFILDVRRSVAFADGREEFLRFKRWVQTRRKHSPRRRDDSPQPRSDRLSDFWMKHLLSPKMQLHLLWRRLKWDFKTCCTAHRGHIHWYDWPLTLLLLVAFKFIERSALKHGLSGEPNLPQTAYR